MNKSTLILVVLSGVAGFSLVWTWLTGFNPITAVTQFISDPVAGISAFISLVTQRLDIVAPVVTVVAGAVALGSRVVNKVKSTAKDTENLLKGQVLEANLATAKLEGNLEAAKATVTEQTSIITQLQTEKNKLNDTITQQNNTIQRLQNDLSYGTKAEKDWVTTEIQKATRKH